MKIKIIKIMLSMLAVAGMLLLIFILLRQNNIFALKTIKIYQNRYVDHQEILNMADFDFTKDIFEIDTEEIEKRINQHPMIEKVTVSRFLPSAIKIVVHEHKIIAGVAGSAVAAVTQSGDIILDYPVEAVYDVPVITGLRFKKDSTGMRIPLTPELFQQGVKILRMIKRIDPLLYYDISEVNFSDDNDMRFILKRGNVPVIFGNDNLIEKMNSFSTIYYHLLEKKALDNVLAIDVRFNGQVVVKQKQ